MLRILILFLIVFLAIGMVSFQIWLDTRKKEELDEIGIKLR